MAVIGEMVSLPMEFAPETSQRTFTFHGNDFVELILVPPLMAALATDAPNVQILFKGPDFKDLTGSLILRLAISPRFHTVGAGNRIGIDRSS